MRRVGPAAPKPIEQFDPPKTRVTPVPRARQRTGHVGLVDLAARDEFQAPTLAVTPVAARISKNA